MSIVEHIEKYFGKISRGWKFFDGVHPYQIVECREGSVEGVVSFCTLGLAHAGLKSDVSDQTIRHELILSVDENEIPKNAIAIVKQLADEVLESNRALLNNQLIHRTGTLFEGYDLSTIWVKPPVFFGDDSFEYTGTDTDESPCVFAWLIPIFDSERKLINKFGVDEFEILLEGSSIDLFSPSRIRVE